MIDTNHCPCCGRHCAVDDLHCQRGKEYFRTGDTSVSQRTHTPNQRSTAGYQNLDMDSRLIINLRDLGHMMRFLFEGKGSQKQILIILQENGCMTQRELTERIGIRPGSASEVIGKLENVGLIERTPSDKDRRTTNIRLTQAGETLAIKAAEQRRQRHTEMFSYLSEEEKDTLLSLLERLNECWDIRYRGTEKGHGHHERHHERSDGAHHHNK